MSVTSLIDRFAPLWAMTLGDRRICIAVLDGPVDRSHVAFRGADLTPIGGCKPDPDGEQGIALQHGTHVASLIFGQHESPIKGIAPRCRGLLVPIFSIRARPRALGCSQVDLAHAISMALEAGAHIINISGGEFNASGMPHPILGEVLNRCERESVLIVAAAGNEGCDCLHVPAAHPSILAVGAANTAGEPLEMSNWGDRYRGHGLLAPGEQLSGAAPGGRIDERSGTSCATALVSGVAGLLMSLEIQKGRIANGPRIRRLLLESADPCPKKDLSACRQYLSGMLNVERALSLISKRDNVMNIDERNTPLNPSAVTGDVRQPAELNDSSLARASTLPVQSPATMEAASHPPTSAIASLPGLTPSACSCGGGAASRQLVFALGQIGVEFSSQARMDSLQQHMPVPPRQPGQVTQTSANARDDGQLLAYLNANPWESSSVIWTLKFGLVPVYAIAVAGPYAFRVGEVLRGFLAEQLANQIERVSLPGVLAGQIRLLTGEQLPVIYPEIRGMYSWRTSALVEAVAGEEPSGRAASDTKKLYQDKTEGIERFLHKVYHELRNLGQSSRDRAINYAATNAFEIAKIFERAAKKDLELHTIDAEPSLACRSGSDCWDVLLRFFSPERDNPLVKHVYRFTVDVSDVVPVTVGPTRDWITVD